jgi:LmbE family N-acetylglucosaminyl deacetylase
MKDLISEISKIIQKVEPGLIYIPNRSDIHTDHQVAFKAIMSCTKVFRNSFIRKILMYECLSETEFSPSLQTDIFIPNVFVDITGFLEEKIKIMNTYRGEMGTFPFPRSEENIRALATYRGATAGVEAAEAFVLLKEVL